MDIKMVANEFSKKTKTEDVVELVVYIFLSIAFLTCFLMLGYACGEGSTQSKAIEAGVAEWRIDPKTGEKSFHFITSSKIESETK